MSISGLREVITIDQSGVLGSGDTGYPLTNLEQAIYSRMILFESLPVMRFGDFAVKKTELKTEPGHTIIIPVFSNLGAMEALVEETPMVPEALANTFVEINTAEYGKATSITEAAWRRARYDMLPIISKALARNYAAGTDLLLRNALLLGMNVLWAGQRASRATLVVGDVFDTTLIRDAVQLLEENDAPRFLPADGSDPCYVCFIHPRQARYLREDTDWVDAAHYGAPVRVFNGECGMFESVRFITTTHVSSVVGSEGTVYQSIIVAENSYGWAVALPPDLRIGGVVDFGRKREFAYITYQGAAILESQNSCILETL